MRARSLAVAVGVLAASCASATAGVDSVPSTTWTATSGMASPALGRDDVAPLPGLVRLVFLGDVMLGRGVAPVVAGDPTTVFERLRPAVVGADLAFANLESPLTRRPHLFGDHALEADPDAAVLLAGAGFDVLGLANNHASDAGPETVVDTLRALEVVGVAGVGGGRSEDDAREPLIVDVGDVRVGIVAFDVSGGVAATVSQPGVNSWDSNIARTALKQLRASVDVVVVGLHGGVEYLRRPDPALTHIMALLADWGVDVVWGHGSHVAYPVEVRDGAVRTSVVAPGLGNALFDQTMPRTRAGLALEVLVDGDGVVAVRSGRVSIEAGRSAFDGWDEPAGDAVALDGEWWTPVRSWGPVVAAPVPAWGDSPLAASSEEVARSVGDVTGTGETDLVLAYRRPASGERAHDTFDEVDWFDEQGRTAHLAVYTRASRMRWGSALLFQPVGAIAVCDGSMSLGFTALDDGAIVSGGAWFWDGFGFRTAAVLPGTGTPACADIDRDGQTDPVLTGRDAGDKTAPGTPATSE